ncbi:putative invertase inhibitor [Phalaenopsis equestris]|uniref:putative invertase inhibitor n=1 Tax=Phalaenopsis equestris TaxID=78828 RepID=UPI0009E325D7|nr:putative invertase inhibitor [Phalaenopsis equestris]
MNKPHSIFILSFPLLLLLAGHPSLAGETLHSLCSFLGGDYVDYNYCVSTLSSNPAASTADGHTLAVIAVNLTVTNATAVKSRADSLSLSSTDSFIRSSLLNCSSLYAAAAPDLHSSAAATAAKNYTGSAAVLADVLRVPAGCDQGFERQQGAVSPIRKENNAFSDLTTLAKAVNNYMAQ